MSERFRTDVRTLCAARDSSDFAALPSEVKYALFRILDKMGAPSGYVPPAKPVMDGFMIGGSKI